MCFLFATHVPEYYTSEPEGEYARFRIDSDRFSTWNQVLPEQNPLVLYRRREFPPEVEGGEPQIVFEPAATFRLPPGEDPVRILVYLDRHGKRTETVITDPRTEHGALMVRAINLADIPVVANFSGKTFVLSPKEERIIGPVEAAQTRFTFQFGNRGDKNRSDYVSPMLPLRFSRENHRLTLIFGYRPEYSETRENRNEPVGYRIDALRFFDLSASPQDAP